jgi:hypothetical protein
VWQVTGQVWWQANGQSKEQVRGQDSWPCLGLQQSILAGIDVYIVLTGTVRKETGNFRPFDLFGMAEEPR